jgi:hypothetical protein
MDVGGKLDRKSLFAKRLHFQVIDFYVVFGSGGEGGIRTHVPELPDHPISSRRRYDHFGTSPDFPFRWAVLGPHFSGLVF